MLLIDKFVLLEQKYQELAEWNTIPYPDVIFSKLQRALFTGIERMVSDLFMFEKMENIYNGPDIHMKLKVLKYNSNLFGIISNFFLKLRNVVVHHGILDIELIQNITINLIELFKANLIFWNNKSFNMFYNQWISIYNKILSQNLFIEEDIPDSMAIEEIIPFRLKMMPLRYYRDNGHREMLIGKSIKILSGKWQGYTSILSKWRGTCVYFLFNGARICIPIDTLVETI